MNKLIVPIVIVFAFIANTVGGQTVYTNTFESPIDITGWSPIGAPYGYNVSDGQLNIEFSDIIALLDNLSGAQPNTEKGLYRSNAGSGFGFLPGNPGWTAQADMNFTADMVNHPGWGWTQNLGVNTSAGILYLGAYNDPVTDQTIWRTGVKSYLGMSWTDLVGGTVNVGWNTAAITATNTFYAVSVNGTELGRYDTFEGYNMFLSEIHLTGYPSYAASGTDGVTRDYSLMFDNIDVSTYSVAAVPEPSIYALVLGIAALGIIAVRRRTSV